MNPPSSYPIIFFDGICGLCNLFVDWVIRRDRKKIFRFAPLQGETAKDFTEKLPAKAEDWSIIYKDEVGIYERSTAILKILLRLGGGWKAMGIFFLLPAPLRDALYRGIAKRRYRWFGKRDACRLPNPSDKDRILP